MVSGLLKVWILNTFYLFKYAHGDNKMRIRKGKWIAISPTDCMTLVPVYECSKCKSIQSGYLTTEICNNCGSVNKVYPTKGKEMAILSKYFEQIDN